MFFGTIGFVAGKGGYPAAGTLLSVSCESTSGTDANGNYFTGAWLAIGNYADGFGGSYTSTIGTNTNGCYYPQGWVQSYDSGDLSLSWTHGEDSGMFSYGYWSSGYVSDGAGGAYSFYDSYVTASDNQLVHSYQEYDYVNGWYNVNSLRFDRDTVSLYTTSYPASGTTLSAACTQVPSTDASGITWTVDSYQRQIADGMGGYYYEDNLNTSTCGYWPSGYYISYSTTGASFPYNDEFNNWVYFTYGDQYDYTQADGSGGSYTGSYVNNLYAAGYVFYSYYDGAGQQTIYYHFDGVNSYYTSTSNP